MRRRADFGWTRIVACVGIAATIGGCGGGGSADPAPASAVGTSGVATPASVTPATGAGPVASTGVVAEKTFPERLLDAMNATRAVARRCGTIDYAATGPLKWDARTEQAALEQAQYLQQSNLFSHAGANGSSVGDRLTSTGYVWSTVGENIAAGYTDVGAVMQGWIDSPGHCANLMNPNYVDLGVAVVSGTSSNTYRTYWGMVLARPR